MKLQYEVRETRMLHILWLEPRFLDELNDKDVGCKEHSSLNVLESEIQNTKDDCILQ